MIQAKTVAMWDNRSTPAGATNALRGLTHSLDLTKEGLAMKATCSIDGCETLSDSHGWCQKHAKRWRKTGDPLKTMHGTPDERFWAKVEPTGFCWLFTGSLTPGGYGSFKPYRQLVPAHRFAYEALVGPIPDDLVLDHLCRVTNCVNPDHLEPITQAENIRRGFAAVGLALRCRNGHPREGNTALNKHGRRVCLTCQRANMLKQCEARKAARRRTKTEDAA